MKMLFCRGCLATDARLFDMRQNGLMEAYRTLLCSAGIVSDDLPHYICSYCAALLLKCDSFRIKCIDSLIIVKNAQQDNLDLTTKNIKIDGCAFLKQTVVNSLSILDKTPKSKSLDTSIEFPLDDDISSGPDIDSDSSIDLNSIDKSDYTSDDEIKITTKDSKHNKDTKQSDSEYQRLLSKYLTKDNGGLLKDFNVNIDKSKHRNAKNIRSKLMQSLSEIIKHIQYSSETSNELFGILDENDPCKDKVPTSVKNSEIDIPKQEYTPILKQEVKKTEIKPTSDTNVENTDLKPNINDNKVKIEIDIEDSIEMDTVNDNLDSDDEKVIADLPKSKVKKANIKESKTKKVSQNKSSKNISSVFKGTQTKKMKNAVELYATYNTDVRYLTKEEQINEIKDRRQSDNYIKGNFKCEICFKGFNARETYENHMTLHDDISGKFVCDVCHCHLGSKARLLGHQNRHAKIFTCKDCGHITRSGSLAAQHHEWHKGKKYTCKDCGKEFQNRSSQYGHKKICHPTSEQLVRCEMCGDSFNGLSGLQHHEIYAHKEKNTSECFCTGCGTQFYCSDAFKAHQGADGACSSRAKYCVRCGGAFRTQLQLEEHEAEQRKQKMQFKCDLCTKTFKQFVKLKMHQRCHRSTYALEAKRNYERKKEREENGASETICEICGKLFRNASLLRSHYTSAHSTAKPYKCTICSKAFKFSTLLLVHTRVHTGERPYKCEHCPKAFQNYPNLKRHNLVHTGERPHSCEVCGKGFQSRGCVKMHVKTVHMKIPMPPRNRNRKKKNE